MIDIEIAPDNQQPNFNTLTNLDQTSLTSIVGDTEKIDSRSLTELLMSQAPQPRRNGFGIILYLPATLDPIEVWNEPVVLIGRRDNRQNIFPTVDLSEHHAAKLGVSRLHAQITFKNCNFHVVDLGSKFGTWVNKTQIKMGESKIITHRDTLRLGHFIIQIGACQYT